jgi:hypothetical protein
MNYSQKPVPPIEVTLKNLGWHMKIISENLAKLTEHMTGSSTQAHTPQNSQKMNDNPYHNNVPF